MPWSILRTRRNSNRSHGLLLKQNQNKINHTQASPDGGAFFIPKYAEKLPVASFLYMKKLAYNRQKG